MNATNHGSRNLILLGIGSIILTVITTSVSLWIYRSSGDIYLDRSRPGFLPDETEAQDEKPVDDNFVFSESGALDDAELQEYLQELKILNDRITSLENPYSSTPLLDESLGITPMSSSQDDDATANEK